MHTKVVRPEGTPANMARQQRPLHIGVRARTPVSRNFTAGGGSKWKRSRMAAAMWHSWPASQECVTDSSFSGSSHFLRWSISFSPTWHQTFSLLSSAVHSRRMVVDQFLVYMGSIGEATLGAAHSRTSAASATAQAREKARTKGDIEPASQQVQQPCQAPQQWKLEFVVVRQIDQDRAQARLQYNEATLIVPSKRVSCLSRESTITCTKRKQIEHSAGCVHLQQVLGHLLVGDHSCQPLL